MKTRIPVSLVLADTIDVPAVQAGASVADYVAHLRSGFASAGKAVAKVEACLNAFARWLAGKGLLKSSAAIVVERLFFEWSKEIGAGKFRTNAGSKYSPSFTQQSAGEIIRHHNIMAGKSSVIARPLVSMRSYPRLARFRKLTATTRKAMLWYEQDGTMADGKRVQAESTRRNAISEAFVVMDALGVNGLESVTEEMVMKYLGRQDADSSAYRRRCRSLCNLKALMRPCLAKGLLPLYPLEKVPNERFIEHYVQDFIVPDHLERLKDMSTVDVTNLEQVRDRLVCLIFADVACRKNELAAIDQLDVALNDGGYDFNLKSSYQKMKEKPSIVLSTYYAQTTTLLHVYLSERRKMGSAGPLFLNKHGRRLSGDGLAACVKRECIRLGISRYFEKNEPPSPHDLRRTFGMCNISPLGLCLGLYDIATRLRDNVEVVTKHYVRSNPLLEGMKAKEYRKRSDSGSNIESGLSAVEALKRCGVPERMWSPIVSFFKERESGNNEPDVLTPSGQWMDKDIADAQFRKAWSVTPNERALRIFLRDHHLSGRSGSPRGKLRYDSSWVTAVTEGYIPAVQLPAGVRSLDSLLSGGSASDKGAVIRIGNFVLVRKNMLASLFTKSSRA